MRDHLESNGTAVNSLYPKTQDTATFARSERAGVQLRDNGIKNHNAFGTGSNPVTNFSQFRSIAA
jgi:hypothetical protein